MCLIKFQWDQHPQYKLILVANRDEFYKRKTAAAHFWQDEPSILGGRDLEAGGTWMGMNNEGKFTALTNYRDIQNIKSQAPSRGHLTANYLKNKQKPEAYLMEVEQVAEAYNGFNLLVGNLEELAYFSNYENQIRKLTPGLYGLSNHLLDTPWYKVEQAKAILEKEVSKSAIDVDYLIESLHSTDKPADNQVQRTGLPLDKERMLASMFIESPDYGTHSTSVMLIDREGQFYFKEKRYHSTEGEPQEREFTFKVIS